MVLFSKDVNQFISALSRGSRLFPIFLKRKLFFSSNFFFIFHFYNLWSFVESTHLFLNYFLSSEIDWTLMFSSRRKCYVKRGNLRNNSACRIVLHIKKRHLSREAREKRKLATFRNEFPTRTCAQGP